MVKNFYLLRMKLNGIKSISHEIELNFYNKILTKFDPDMYRIKAVYGENGSGKTGIVTAVNLVKKVVLSKDYLLQQEVQSLLNEIINKKTQQLKVELEFAYDGKELYVYRYAISISKVNDVFEITHESLDVIHGYTKNKKFVNVFEIEAGVINNLALPDDKKALIEKETMNLLSMSSFVLRFITVDKNEDEKAYVDILAVVAFFIVVNTYLDEEDMHEMYVITNLLRNVLSIDNKEDQSIVNEFIDKQINYLDSKGRDVVDKKNYASYQKKVKRLESFLKIFKKDLKSISIDKRDAGDNYRCELILNYKGYSVNREFESTGIKKLIKMYDSLANVDAGGISFIDEMDSNLNDIYLCKMIEYFMYYSKGQLCFTTHNLDPMTVLKSNRNSIDFLSANNIITSWKVTGNAAPDRYYKNGMIENSPFNIEPVDFIGMFG